MDNQVRYDYSDVPTIWRFSQDNTIIRGMMGPFGCISGDSLIVTERGLVPIASLTQPERVLSWNEMTGRFQLSLSGGAFPKGKDYLYRVITPKGEFVAAGCHHVLCADNKYQPVQNLLSGQSLSLCSDDPTQILTLAFRLALHLGVPHCLRTISDSMAHYATLARLYGQQFLRAISSARSPIPLPVDAQGLHDPLADSDGGERMDDWWELSPLHIHHDLFSVHKRIDDFLFQAAPHNEVDQDLIWWQPSSHIWKKGQLFLRFALSYVCRHIERLSASYSHSSTSPLSNRPILSVERRRVKENFWDMQVLDTNNYVTSDGTIHHNSGKSSGAGVMEVVKRACAQAPSSRDNIRKTRCAIVRNTFPQLRDTTQKTWDHWMTTFGYWEKTARNFQLRLSAPDASPVECEVMFRALDDPDDVKNLLSLDLTFIWFNEVKEIAKLIFDTSLGRCGRYPAMDEGGASWWGMFGDTNPPDTDSWFYNLFEEERPLMCPTCQNPDGGMVLYTPREIDGRRVPPKCPNCGKGEEAGIPITAIYKQPSGRSPQAENLRNLPKGYYSNLMIGKDSGWINVYVDGKYGYVRDGKPVYPNWSDHFHLVPNEKILKELEAHLSYPLICGWDCTGNHQAWTINQRLPSGKFCTYDEIFSESTDARTFLRDIVKPFMWANYTGIPWSRIYVIQDPASKRSDTNPSNAKAEAKLLGIPNVVKAFSNSWDARYGAVNRLLIAAPVDGSGRYQLNQRCKIAHKGFLGEYRMERKQVSGKEIFKDQPVKNKASDVHDSIQYAAMGPSREDEDDLHGFGGHAARDHSGHISLGAHL